MDMVLCPVIFMITLRSTPAFRILVLKVRLRSWNLKFPITPFLQAFLKELAVKLRELEGRIQEHDDQIVAIFEAIRQLMTPPETPRKRIGFEPNIERILRASLGVPPLRGGAHFLLSFVGGVARSPG